MAATVLALVHIYRRLLHQPIYQRFIICMIFVASVILPVRRYPSCSSVPQRQIYCCFREKCPFWGEFESVLQNRCY